MEEIKEENSIKDEKKIIRVSLVEFIFYIFNIAYVALYIYFYRKILILSFNEGVHVVTIYKNYLRILIFQILSVLISMLLVSFAYKENLKRKRMISNIFYIINVMFMIAIIVGFNSISVSLVYFFKYINVIRILASILAVLILGVMPIKSMLKMTKEIDKIY